MTWLVLAMRKTETAGKTLLLVVPEGANLNNTRFAMFIYEGTKKVRAGKVYKFSVRATCETGMYYCYDA